jgi:hypothetical protein
VSGHPTPPFSMNIPWDVISTNVTKNQEVADKIKEQSRLKYGVPAKEVEEYINLRAGFNEEKKIPF